MGGISQEETGGKGKDTMYQNLNSIPRQNTLALLDGQPSHDLYQNNTHSTLKDSSGLPNQQQSWRTDPVSS